MKKAKLIVVLIVFLGMVGFMAVPQASAQVLDDMWFKLSCQIKAVQQNTITGGTAPFNLNFTAYLRFSYFGEELGIPLYFINVWSRTSPGHWVITGNENPNPALPWTDQVFPDFGIQFYGEGHTYIISYITPFVNNMLTTLFAQGEIFAGWNSAGNAVYGGINIQGQAIPESQVPPAILHTETIRK